MAKPKVTKFKTKNTSDAFWAGYSKQTIDFQNALGELVDNALSGRLPKSVGEGLQTAVIEITLHERDNGSVVAQIADAGVGVPREELVGEDNIFNLGYQPPSRGTMNEHGFGLKNALALMTSGFHGEFTFFSHPATEPDAIYAVDGPLQEEMEARTTTMDEWASDLDILAAAPSGVKVKVEVRREYFSSVYARPAGFDALVERLCEHLGVMYPYYIEEGNELVIRHRSKNASSWTAHAIPAIHTPFLANEVASVEENAITFERDSVSYGATFKRGILDKDRVKDVEGTEGWPFPLKIHFQGSNARCGVSYVVRKRVLKTGVFREIWPEHSGDVSFNNYLGELSVDEDFSTTNNKTDLDPHDAAWAELVSKIHDDFPPEKTTKKQSEEGLRKAVIRQLATVHDLTGAKKPHKKKVWDGYAEIDIYYELRKRPHILETKIGAADVACVYQLLMYWDGLVREKLKPASATLIAATIPEPVEAAIEQVNARTDADGNLYKFKGQTHSDWSTT